MRVSGVGDGGGSAGAYQRGEDERVIDIVAVVGVRVAGCFEECRVWRGGERLLFAEGGAG